VDGGSSPAVMIEQGSLQPSKKIEVEKDWEDEKIENSKRKNGRI
jgi:hypothetical protein